MTLEQPILAVRLPGCADWNLSLVASSNVAQVRGARVRWCRVCYACSFNRRPRARALWAFRRRLLRRTSAQRGSVRAAQVSRRRRGVCLPLALPGWCSMPSTSSRGSGRQRRQMGACEPTGLGDSVKKSGRQLGGAGALMPPVAGHSEARLRRRQGPSTFWATSSLPRSYSAVARPRVRR